MSLQAVTKLNAYQKNRRKLDCFPVSFSNFCIWLKVYCRILLHHRISKDLYDKQFHQSDPCLQSNDLADFCIQYCILSEKHQTVNLRLIYEPNCWKNVACADLGYCPDHIRSDSDLNDIIVFKGY